jgi:hypothetical protein
MRENDVKGLILDHKYLNDNLEKKSDAKKSELLMNEK